MFRHPASARRTAAPIVVAALALLGAPPAAGATAVRPAPPSAAASAVDVPQLVRITAGYHSGYDRIVFTFTGASAPRAAVTAVPTFIADFSGQTVQVPGRAILRVVITGAQAHTNAGAPTVRTSAAYALPNIMSLRPGGDFEGVITLGIGLAKPMGFHVHRLSNPGRVVVDVSNNFAWTHRQVRFLNQPNFAVGRTPYTTAVSRPVPTAYPATGLLDRLFAGPTSSEYASGLRFVNSKATGFANLSITNQIARVRLTGGCSSGGSTFTIASQLMPTLRPLPSVSWIKIYYPAHVTQSPTGPRDSIPTCLEP